MLCLATTICAEESKNLIEKDKWVLEGDVWMQESSGGKDYESDFNIRFGKEGGTATQQLDFSVYEQVDVINYSMMAIGCNNIGNNWCDTGTAYDELIVTLNYGEEQFVHNIKLDHADGFTMLEASSIPTGYSTTGSVSIWGKDVGVWNGWYGPVTADHQLSVTYSIPQYDVVLDDPNFLNNITGVQDNIMDVAVTSTTQELPVVQEVQEIIVVDVEVEIPLVQQEMTTNVVEAQQEIELVELEEEIVQVETLSESNDTKQEQEQEQPTTNTKSVRLDNIMANVTIGGVPATELGQVDAYNQVAQAVAISLLTATKIKDTYIADAPFYNQEQLEDATLNDSYTGYVAINRSKINQLMDMQWQRLR